MTSLSDTLTIGLVLVLLFGSIAIYLYTRIQQAEQKISLLESILLDLKMSSEIKSYTELPATNVSSYEPIEEYAPFTDDNDTIDVDKVDNTDANKETTTIYEPLNDNDEEDFNSQLAPNDTSRKSSRDHTATGEHTYVSDESIKQTNNGTMESARVSLNYESMTIKELSSLARSKSIPITTNMKKNAIIDLLKTLEYSVEPGSNSEGGLSSFLETSSPVSE